MKRGRNKFSSRLNRRELIDLAVLAALDTNAIDDHAVSDEFWKKVGLDVESDHPSFD